MCSSDLCVWARVDEDHLAECLRRAAAASSEASGAQLRAAARARVAKRCGIDAVARRMAAALEAML